MGIADVSAREAEVLRALGRNRSNVEIAAELFISVRTVESHVSSLLRKLGAPNRQALGRLALPPAPAPGLVGAPGTFTSFVGRRDEAEQLRLALTQGRLVTLTGPGGVGKTRLAVETASSAADSPGWFVDLLPAGPAWVVQSVAKVIGVSERPDQSLLEAVTTALAVQEGLLVLDNCEHVLDAVGELLGALLRSCPSLRVLATSREPIDVPGERVVPLGPLPLTAAGAAGDAPLLFAERAAAAGARVDPEDPTVQEVCSRLDGMPLAIELAAVRCASLGLHTVREALADRLALLAGSRDHDQRHRSLRATLDWSFALLSDAERERLRPLGVFVGWFTPTDASAVASAAGEPMILSLGRLAAKSLLVRADAAEGTLFRPLESVRAYLLERLAAEGELDAALARHLAWAANQAVALESLMLNGGTWRPGFERVIDDLRAALQRAPRRPAAEAARARSLARSLGHLCYGHHAFMEGHAHYRQAATFADEASEAVDDLALAGHCAFSLGHGDAGYDAFIEAAEIGAGAGLTRDASLVLAVATAHARRFRGLFRRDLSVEELEDNYQRAASLGEGLGGTVEAQLACARAWLDGPGFAAAEGHAAVRAVELSRASGDAVLLSQSLDAWAAALVDQGGVAAAAQLNGERVALLELMASHDPRAGAEQVDIRHMALDSALVAGDPASAVALGERFAADALAGQLTHFIRRGLVVAHALLGDFDSALAHAEAMRHAWESVGRPGARWMAPGAWAASLVHGLREDDEARAAWDSFGERLAQGSSADFSAFTRARLALHRGDVRGAGALAASDRGVSPRWGSYLAALQAEIAALQHPLELSDLVRGFHAQFDRQPFAEAMLLRAEARATGDRAGWRRAADAFSAVGARFEWACTLVLANGAVPGDGGALLRSLQCQPPAA